MAVIHRMSPRRAREMRVAINACPRDRDATEPSCVMMRNAQRKNPTIAITPASCMRKLVIKSSILRVSSNTILRMINPSAMINTIPISVRMVMRRDLMIPRALQRVTKKNTPIKTPTMRAVIGLRKYDVIQMDMSVMLTAMRVFQRVFQNHADSSLRSAKKTNKRLKIATMLRATSIQNPVFPSVK